MKWRGKSSRKLHPGSYLRLRRSRTTYQIKEVVNPRFIQTPTVSGKIGPPLATPNTSAVTIRTIITSAFRMASNRRLRARSLRGGSCGRGTKLNCLCVLAEMIKAETAVQSTTIMPLTKNCPVERKPKPRSRARKMKKTAPTTDAARSLRKLVFKNGSNSVSSFSRNIGLRHAQPPGPVMPGAILPDI